MGCNFSASLVYGVKVSKGSLLPKSWEYDDDGFYKETRPFRVIDHGGYTDFEDNDCIVGDYLDTPNIENSMDTDSIKLTSVGGNDKTLEKIQEIMQLLDKYNVPYEDSGIFIVPCWS